MTSNVTISATFPGDTFPTIFDEGMAIFDDRVYQLVDPDDTAPAIDVDGYASPSDSIVARVLCSGDDAVNNGAWGFRRQDGMIGPDGELYVCCLDLTRGVEEGWAFIWRD